MFGKVRDDCVISVCKKAAQFFYLIFKRCIQRDRIPAFVAFGGGIGILRFQLIKEGQNSGRLKILIGHIHKGQNKLTPEILISHEGRHRFVIQKSGRRIVGTIYKGVDQIGR